MSAEATVNISLGIRQGTSPVVRDYRSNPTQFNVTVTAVEGPAPGYVQAQRNGTIVDLSKLTTIGGGLCWIHNLDATNFITVGIYDPENKRFFPLMEIGPAEFYVLKLSRYLQEEQPGTGTGTASVGGATNRLMVKADQGVCNVEVLAFGA